MVDRNSDVLVSQLPKEWGKPLICSVCQYLWLNKIFPPWQMSNPLNAKLVLAGSSTLTEAGGELERFQGLPFTNTYYICTCVCM